MNKKKEYIFVYRTINKTNNKEYIGVHTTDKLNDNYFGSGKLISRAVRKYGNENFKQEILKFFKSEEDAYEYEKKIVNESYVARKDTYNLVPGGSSPPTYYGEQHPRHVSITKIQEKLILELYKDGYGLSLLNVSIQLNISPTAVSRTIENAGIDISLSAVHKRKKLGKTWEEIYSPEGLEIMEKVKKKNGKRLGAYNMSLPKEERIKRAKHANAARQLIGYSHSEETKRKIGLAHKGTTLSAETRALISKNVKIAMQDINEEVQIKATAGRKKYYKIKHEQDRKKIIELQKQGLNKKEMRTKLGISQPTLDTRLREIAESR